MDAEIGTAMAVLFFVTATFAGWLVIWLMGSVAAGPEHPVIQPAFAGSVGVVAFTMLLIDPDALGMAGIPFATEFGTGAIIGSVAGFLTGWAWNTRHARRAARAK